MKDSESKSKFHFISTRRFFWALLASFLGGIIVESFFDPYIARFLPWRNPPGTLHVSVVYDDVPIGVNQLSDPIILFNSDRNVLNKSPSKPTYTWVSLQPGRYKVDIFVCDMFVGTTGWLELGPEQEMNSKVTIVSPAELQVVVYDEAQKPIEAAIVAIRSHRGRECGSARTNAKGETGWLYLAPTGGEDTYKIEVLYENNLIASKDKVTLASGKSQIRIVKGERH